MKALVTGGTGFVGSHLARALTDAGHEVRVLHRASSKLTALEGIKYESALGDVTDSAALEAACTGCDWVFHVAAVADYWRADKSHMFEVNIEGTRRVLAAARNAGVKRVTFTSSAAAVGLSNNAVYSDESVPFNLEPKHFPYGYSKSLAERVVQEAVAQGQDVVTLNPVIILGPGDLNMISGTFIVQTQQFGRFTPITSGGIAVVDVRDVARWHIAAAEKGISGERYILGTANYNYRTWFDMIADVVGVAPPMFTVPDFLIPLAASINDRLRQWGINTPIDADQVRLSTRDIYFNFSKAWETFGPPQIDMLQSLKDTYHWYRENGYMK